MASFVHVSALHNLPAMSKETATKLHALRDIAEELLAALRSLGRSDHEILSDILIYFITQKLDSPTKRT